MLFLGLLAAVATFSVCGVGVFVVACRIFQGQQITFRLAAAVGLFYWLALWCFQVLGILGALRLPVVILLLLVIPLLVLIRFRVQVATTLGDAEAELKSELEELGGGMKKEPVVAAAVSVVALHLTVRFARVLATPTFGWDDFTYHLFRAGRWVQTGGVGLEPAPDAWTYYEFFPWGGDALWAWALIWGAGDILVPVVAIGIWLSTLVAAYALVRTLGGEPVTGLLVALAISTLPSQLTQLNTAYVDNVVLLMALIAGLCVAAIENSRATGGGGDIQRAGLAWVFFLFGSSCGLGMATKLTFLPVAAAAGLLTAWWAWRWRKPTLLGGFLAGSLVVAPTWVFSLLHRGSPFYPFRVLESLPYNQALEELLSAAPAKEYGAAVGGALKALLVNIREVDPFLNVGWQGLCLLILGLVGGVRRSRAMGSYLLAGWSLIAAVSVAAPAMVGKGVLLLVQWLNVLGRFWVPGFAALFALAALSGKRLVRWLVLPLMLLELFVYAPRKWPSPIPAGTLRIWIIGLLLLIAIWLGCRRWGSGWLKRAVFVIMVATAFVAMSPFREATRYDTYRLFADWELDDFHHNNYIRGWPLWQELDTKGPKTVAATAGYGGGIGHNWFRSPLLGSRLQNEVLYIPVTTGGELVSYKDPKAVAAAADQEAWLRRLEERQVDYVAALGPRSIEHEWLEELPGLFSIELESRGGSWILARVDPAALGGHLSGDSKAESKESVGR